MTRCAFYGLFLQTLLCSLLLAEGGSAQNMKLQEVRLSLDLKEAPLVEAFSQMEQKAGFNFIYEKKLANKKQKVSLKANNESMYDLLLHFSREVNVQFRRVNENIYVSPRTGASKEENAIIDNTLVDVAITGTIIDENGEGLPGASVVVKGTTIGTTTDLEGKYRLSVPEQSTVVVSFVGYKTSEILVTNQSVIDVQMQLDAEQLEEVVVVGYGSVKKSDLTGSVSQIRSEELTQYPAYDISQTLKGRASGVMITQNSGTPGGRIEVRIRGGNSMIGSNNPLYVVDGFPITGGITYLNPADIESIDILKDASATAIYGARGANGVVIITSKSGKKNQNGRIEIDSYTGVQNVPNPYDLLDAKQYAIIANEFLTNNGQPIQFDPDTIPSGGTDWQDVIFRSASLQNHTITFSDGNERTTYAISGNYYNQEGVVINTGIRRGSVRFNLNSELNGRIKFGTNVTLSRRERLSRSVDNGNLGANLLSSALAAPPLLPVYDENGLPTRINQAYAFGSADMRNPMQFAAGKSKSTGSSVIGNTFIELSITDKLSLRSILGVEYNQGFSERFSPIIYDGDRGSAGASSSYTTSVLNENLLNYNTKFGEIHELNFVAGFTTQNYSTRNFGIGVSGFSNNTTQDYNLAAAETIGNPSSGITEWSLASILGRVNYTLKDKYLFTISMRSDGSSRFASGNKWSVFPSGAFAWRVSDEDFMQNIGVVTDLKLRTSYGVTGNQGIGAYQTLNRLSSVKTIYGSGQDVIGFAPAAMANSDLKWETTTQMDIGFDLGLVDNRINITFDYYKKKTTDLLASVPLPPSVGFGSILKNIGEIKNTGMELSIDGDILVNEFKWNVTLQISGNRNEVIKLAEGNDVFGGGIALPFSSSINITRQGDPFGLFYGLIEDGLDDNGFIQYVDQLTEDTDGDGINDTADGSINSLDRVIIGNPYPDFIFGFSSNFSYKNFDLSIFLEGVSGNDIFFATAGSHLNSFQRGTNQFTDLIGNYWTSENPDPNAKYPRISSATQHQVSDRFIEDGSYLRIKTLKLGYNLPVKKIGISSWFRTAQVYVSAVNLATFTNYAGYDPEVNTTGTDSQSVGSRLRLGIDQGAYPNSRTFGMGLKLGF